MRQYELEFSGKVLNFIPSLFLRVVHFNLANIADYLSSIESKMSVYGDLTWLLIIYMYYSSLCLNTLLSLLRFCLQVCKANSYTQ